MIYYGLKKDVVLFAKDLSQSLNTGSASTTIISVGRSGESFALIVIDFLSEDTVVKLAPYYSLKRMSTWLDSIRDG